MLIGHRSQIEFLNRIISLKKIPHALLFQGYEKLGKKTIAIDFAKKIINGSSPDLILISPEKKEIQISQIRDLSYKLSFRPYSAEFKVAIIDDAHLMNIQAQNSLLKTLEEPGESSIIILVSSHPEMILPTIRSRISLMKFFPVQSEDLLSAIEKIGVTDKKANEIVLFSFGRPGIAIDFLNNPEMVNFRKSVINDLLKVIDSKSSFHLRFDYVKKISDDSEKLNEILGIWLSYFRVLFLEKSKGKKGINYNLLSIINILKEIDKSIYLLSKTNATSKLVMETLIMKL